MIFCVLSIVSYLVDFIRCLMQILLRVLTLIDQGIGSVRSAWVEMWSSRGVLTDIFKTLLLCLLIETTTDTHILNYNRHTYFKHFYCILVIFWIFSSFFSYHNENPDFRFLPPNSVKWLLFQYHREFMALYGLCYVTQKQQIHNIPEHCLFVLFF